MTRVVLGICLGLLIGAMSAKARPPVPPDVFVAVRTYWHTKPERVKAFDILWCESRYSTRARNGQFLGSWQMGAGERARCGHGVTARAQARAARCWFDLTGHDFGAWSCA